MVANVFLLRSLNQFRGEFFSEDTLRKSTMAIARLIYHNDLWLPYFTGFRVGGITILPLPRSESRRYIRFGD